MMAPNRDMISKSRSPTMHSRISVTAERQQKSQQQQKGQGCGVVYTITPKQEVMRWWQILPLYEVMTSVTPLSQVIGDHQSWGMWRERERDEGGRDGGESKRIEEEEERKEGGRGKVGRKGQRKEGERERERERRYGSALGAFGIFKISGSTLLPEPNLT